MVYLLYNFILLLSSLFLVPYYLVHGLRYGKSRRGIRERLGYFTAEFQSKVQGRRIIWLHAVSVGETRAAIPLIRELRKDYPDFLILVSNVTETGHSIACEVPGIDHCIFFPFDFSWTVRKVFQLIAPELVIIVETEIWPNFTRQAKRLDIPLILVNGRLSDRSYPRYRFARCLLRPVLDCFAAFCMQSQTDAERIVSLGVKFAKVENTGNMKFDHELKNYSVDEVAKRKHSYRIPEQTAVIVAGSTHDGEEQLLLESFQQISQRVARELRLVIIPRHPERKKEVLNLFRSTALQGRLRTELQADDALLNRDEVLVVDTLGEVLDFYSIADIVFVGGSFVPIGGHNLLEASLLAKPVLFGHYVHNFKEISKKLERAGAGVKVNGLQEFEDQCVLMLNDSVRCQAMGEAGRALIVENSGATARTMRHIRSAIG